MATWPTTLPQSLHQNGFQYRVPDGSIRTDMDTGKAFQRRRYTAAVEPFSGKIWVTQAQYASLLDFWKNTTAMGSLEFDWKHPITGDPATIRFISNEPLSVKPLSGDQYEVNLNLEVIPNGS